MDSETIDIPAPSILPRRPSFTVPSSRRSTRIMSAVQSVPKSQKNQHGGYMFASTDDIYAATTHKMGECGLVIITREDSCEIVRVEKEERRRSGRASRFHSCSPLLKEHGPIQARRTLYIQVTGAQTFQAAQSYAEKSFMRSLFKLPTGDMDLDGMPQGETEEDQIGLNQPAKRKSSSGAKKDGSDKTFNEIRRAIADAPSGDYLQQVRTIYADGGRRCRTAGSKS